MAIEFEDLGGGEDLGGNGSGALRLRARGFAEVIAVGEGYGTARLFFRSTSAGFDIGPEDPTYSAGSGFFKISAIGYANDTLAPTTGEASVLGITIVARGYPGVNHGASGVTLRARGSEVFDPEHSSAPYDVAVGVDNPFFGTAAMEARVTALLQTGVRFEEIISGPLETSVATGDSIEFADVLRIIYRELIEISVALGVTDVVDYRAMALMVDRLLLSGIVTTALEAHKLIVDALVLGDLVYNSWRDLLEDGLVLSEAHADELTAMHVMVDEALFGAVGSEVATLQVLIPDGVEFNAEQDSFAEMASQLRDNLAFVLRLSVDNFQYTAWTVNAATSAHARYTNYPFNGFMKIGSKYYGTSEQGLFRLEGADDDGTAIASKIRAGMSKLNNGNMKTIQSMYLGYKADGDLLVKVIIADDHNSQREAHIYKLVERGGGSQREGRVPVGRGLQSVYWDYEIHNADGADFELDTVEILPLIHERRIRGSSGGKA